jgi:hypothetical protein
MSDLNYLQLKEMLKDADDCPRLSKKERDFLTDIRGKVVSMGARCGITDKQQAWLKVIERKVYAPAGE